MHQTGVILDLVDEGIQANVVQRDHDESVDCRDGMIRLVLLNIDLVSPNHPDGLETLDVVDEADQLVFTAEEALEKKDHDNRVDTLKPKYGHSSVHEILTDLQVLRLQSLQSNDVLLLLLNEVGFLGVTIFALALALQLVSDLFQVVFGEDVGLVEQVANAISCLLILLIFGFLVISSTLENLRGGGNCGVHLT